MEYQTKYQSLLNTLKGFERVAVAFSGGVDSTLLLYGACEALGRENVFVMRGLSELISGREVAAAANLLVELEISRNHILEIELHPLIWPEFVANTADRCYFCKKRMYQTFQRELEKYNCSILLDGSNVDDLKRHRPGFRAIHELGVKTPLLDVALSKDDIRSLAAGFRLSNHNKLSNSCLATRIPEGTVLEKKYLHLVEECEEFLVKRGYPGCRVKPDRKDVVLELNGTDFENVTKSSVRIEIIHFFQSMGFERVLLDLKPRL